MRALMDRDDSIPSEPEHQRRRARHRDLYAAALTGLLANSDEDEPIMPILESAATVADAAMLFEEHRYLTRGLPAKPKATRA